VRRDGLDSAASAVWAGSADYFAFAKPLLDGKAVAGHYVADRSAQRSSAPSVRLACGFSHAPARYGPPPGQLPSRYRAAFSRLMRSRRLRHLSRNWRIALISIAGLLSELTNIKSAASEYPANVQPVSSAYLGDDRQLAHGPPGRMTWRAAQQPRISPRRRALPRLVTPGGIRQPPPAGPFC
jgi:hypothetical protein